MQDELLSPGTCCQPTLYTERISDLPDPSGIKILVSGKILKVIMGSCPPIPALSVTIDTAIELFMFTFVMQDDGKSLAECGVSSQSRLLVTKGASHAADMTKEEQRMKHLDKLKAVAESMASRDGSGLTDAYEFSLENQVNAESAERLGLPYDC
jgi:hypothetical protein